MFYVIGLGLGDAKDVTVKGLEIIRKCDRVYLESYTSILAVQQETLVRIVFREMTCYNSDAVDFLLNNYMTQFAKYIKYNY